MTDPMLSVCWKNHTSELATVYQNLLENNFLVDCTISAEGQSLKAHRLVLSACSPYFHKLFKEETGKHPFVILLDASFETLKAVIDFIYRGEAQIPTVSLKEFLTLAHSLRIKGLNAFTQGYVNRIISRNTTENVYIPSEDNEDTQEVQDVSGNRKDNLQYSSQPHPHLSESFSDNVHTHSSVPYEAYSASSEEVQSVMPPPQEHQRTVQYNEMSEDMEVTVKQEPFFSAYSETNKKVDNIKRGESMSGSFMSEMDDGSTFVTGEQDLNHYPKETSSEEWEEGEDAMPSRKRPLTSLQFKEKMIAHLPEMTNVHNSVRCKNRGCSKKTKIKCRGCEKFLCLTAKNNCFSDYHESCNLHNMI